MRVNNDQTWILGNSFQKFLNAQDVYQIKPKPDCTNVSNEIAVEVKEYISRTDAAALAGVKPSTITKWVQLEKFSCVGAGSVLRIHRKTFLKWLKEYQKV